MSNHATTFEVMVSLDESALRDHIATTVQRTEIIASFVAALDHWIAEQRLELK